MIYWLSFVTLSQETFEKDERSMHQERDPWTDVSPEVCAEARELAAEVIRRMLVWTADAPTMLDRGLRATVALHCLRPDLIGSPTLDRVGDQAARTRQHVHALAKEFKMLMGEGEQP